MDAPFVWGDAGSVSSPEGAAAKRRVAMAMLERGGDSTPVQHWTQGLARVTQALMGGMMMRGEDDADKAANALRMTAPGLEAPLADASSSVPAPSSTIPAGKDAFVSTLMPLAQEASAKTGIDPKIIVAQAALESGWGEHAPGNNLFGIKSHGQPGGNILPTTEVVNGQPIKTSDGFRAYGSPAESVNGYTDFINSNPRYAALKSAQGTDAQVAALGKSGYATDPAYGSKVGQIVQALSKDQPVVTAQAAPQAQAQPMRSPVSIPPAMQTYIKALMSNPRTQAEGYKLYQQYAQPKDQWVTERGQDGSIYQTNALTGEKKVIEKSDVLPQAAADQRAAIARAGKPDTTINNTVNPVVKGIGDRFNGMMDTATTSATELIPAIHEARKAIDQGVISGLGADPKLFAAKAANLFGLGSDAASNTEVLRSAVGNQVLAKAKTLGANPSNADRDYIEKVQGGSIALEESSMRRLLDIQEKWGRQAIDRANAMGKQLLDAQPGELKTVAPLLSVKHPPTYDDFLKGNPINRGSPALDAARDAISKGAPRDAVIKRLRDGGIDPSGL